MDMRIGGVNGAVVSQAADAAPLTHQHLFCVIQTLVAEGRLNPRPGIPLRILDIGCGDGRLIESLMTLFERAQPGLTVELHGFDIGEQGYADSRQLPEAATRLATIFPGVDWAKRLRLVADAAEWGYPAGYFDAAVSNQVIEHVDDLDHMLRQIGQCVHADGITVHLFPLSHCIQEAHCLVPFAHWIRNFDQRADWIAMLSRWGIGRYRRDRAILGHATPDIHGIESAKYIQCWTHYRSFRSISAHCYRRSLSISYDFTKDFFFSKLRRLLRLEPAAQYRRWRWLGLEWLGFMIGRYLSSATIVISPVRYDIGGRIAAEKAAGR